MELIDRLRAAVSDDRDIDPILAYAADGGKRNVPNGSIEYLGTTGGGVYAKAKFKHGKIVSIIPGPLLTSSAAQDALVHGTCAARVDLDFFSPQSQDHLLLLEIVCQRSLINWLRDAAQLNRSSGLLRGINRA